MYFAEDGKLDYSISPIWKGKFDKAYISPNSKFALLFDDSTNKLTLIDSKGTILFNLEDVNLHLVDEYRKSKRFNISQMQWSKNSDYFIIGQDRIWDSNYSENNKSSIYKYSVIDNTFNSLIDLEEELINNFIFDANENHIYYEFATEKGDLALKKIDLISKTVISEHFKNSNLKLEGINEDSIFVNYDNFKADFQYNSFDLNSIITTAIIHNEIGLYYKNKDTTIQLLNGQFGYSDYTNRTINYFKGGFFLPDNRYFIANIYSKDFTGQLVIDTQTFKIKKLNKNTNFYFNINSLDCSDYVYRYDIVPNVQFATSVTLKIERENE
ncbi:hypothetical protein WAF17_05425 [Bernardetia sp. ABR2-2B]|uniref:hypothetical protein n=1 Tax=Bernardetia sp. ABR2-2B TaxID=3127472 RepID=UPI0030CF36AC